MNLLENNNNIKNKKTPAQKIVLLLLIISIVLCIIIGIAMVLVSINDKASTYAIVINDVNMDLSQLQLLVDENGKKYIPLKSICNQLGYSYYNGEFKVAEEDKTKGYIDNGTNIIQFYTNSNRIYKTNESSNIDFEYYNLNNKILTSQNNLYIAIDDLNIALNLLLGYSKDNSTLILTPEYWISKNETFFKERGITISTTPENKKALSYGYCIINKDNKYGVINLNGEELIGNKYSSITFVEYLKQFIVTNSNKQFGIISNDGSAIINLQYDSLEILNYNPLLYKVKKLQKYGIIKENGTVVNDIIFDAVGYPKNIEKGINYTLIVPSIKENVPESIIVYKNGKYGLMNLGNGEMVLDCNLNGIYSITRDNVVYYIVETNDSRVFLENYINNLNRLTVNLE